MKNKWDTERFWITDYESPDMPGDWNAVCDEESGGYIAYFRDIADAEEFCIAKSKETGR